jgi:hypothetical protein
VSVATEVCSSLETLGKPTTNTVKVTLMENRPARTVPRTHHR